MITKQGRFKLQQLKKQKKPLPVLKSPVAQAL
jgi:hypothetical protein